MTFLSGNHALSKHLTEFSCFSNLSENSFLNNSCSSRKRFLKNPFTYHRWRQHQTNISVTKQEKTNRNTNVVDHLSICISRRCPSLIHPFSPVSAATSLLHFSYLLRTLKLVDFWGSKFHTGQKGQIHQTLQQQGPARSRLRSLLFRHVFPGMSQHGLQPRRSTASRGRGSPAELRRGQQRVPAA